MKTLSVVIATGFMLTAVAVAAQTESRDMLACQKQLNRQVQSLTRLAARKLQGCADKVVKCNLTAEIDGVDPTSCLEKASTACGKVGPSLANSAVRKRDNLIKKCGLIPVGELEQYIAGLGFVDVSSSCETLAPPLTPIAIVDATDLIDCTLVTTQCAVEREVYLRDPRALDSLTDAAVAASFPCVGA